MYCKKNSHFNASFYVYACIYQKKKQRGNCQTSMRGDMAKYVLIKHFEYVFWIFNI